MGTRQKGNNQKIPFGLRGANNLRLDLRKGSKKRGIPANTGHCSRRRLYHTGGGIINRRIGDVSFSVDKGGPLITIYIRESETDSRSQEVFRSLYANISDLREYTTMKCIPKRPRRMDAISTALYPREIIGIVFAQPPNGLLALWAWWAKFSKRTPCDRVGLPRCLKMVRNWIR